MKSDPRKKCPDTIYKLQQRVQNYSTEAGGLPGGSEPINIDIPGVSMQTQFWKNSVSQVP